MEFVACLLAIVIPLHLVSLSFAQAVSCVQQGYDLTSLTSTDLFFFGTGNAAGNGAVYAWAIRPCGSVNTTGYCSGEFCQGQITISSMNSTLVKNSAVWAQVNTNGQQGVAQLIQDGDPCDDVGTDRQGTIQFLCNPNAVPARISSILETTTCHYQAIVQTAVVCPTAFLGYSSSGGTAILASPSNLLCGGGIYDLSPLNSQDFVGVVNSTSGGFNYTFVVRVCGNVTTTSSCSGTPYTSVCQYNTQAPTSQSYSLATYQPLSSAVVWVYNGNSLSQIVQDGLGCNNQNRFTNITFICNSTASSPIVLSVVESPTCHYTLLVQTSAVCAAAFTVLDSTVKLGKFLLCSSDVGLSYISTLTAVVWAESFQSVAGSGVWQQYLVLNASGSRAFIDLTHSTSPVEQLSSLVGLNTSGYIYPGSSVVLDSGGLIFHFADALRIAGATNGSNHDLRVWYSGASAYSEQVVGGAVGLTPVVRVVSLVPFTQYAQCSLPEVLTFSFSFAMAGNGYSVSFTGFINTTAVPLTISPNSGNQLSQAQNAFTAVSASGTRLFTDFTTGQTSTSSVVGLSPGFIGATQYIYYGSSTTTDWNGIAFIMDSIPVIAGQRLSGDGQLVLWWEASRGQYLEETEPISFESTPYFSALTVTPCGSASTPCSANSAAAVGSSSTGGAQSSSSSSSVPLFLILVTAVPIGGGLLLCCLFAYCLRWVYKSRSGQVAFNNPLHYTFNAQTGHKGTEMAKAYRPNGQFSAGQQPRAAAAAARQPVVIAQVRGQARPPPASPRTEQEEKSKQTSPPLSPRSPPLNLWTDLAHKAEQKPKFNLDEKKADEPSSPNVNEATPKRVPTTFPTGENTTKDPFNGFAF